ncbi:sulfurtransferase TusA family protein [Eubacterium aggregans]
MMNKHLDASGQACPLPIMMGKKEIDAGTTDLTITVDNDMAVENLKKTGQ